MQRSRRRYWPGRRFQCVKSVPPGRRFQCVKSVPGSRFPFGLFLPFASVIYIPFCDAVTKRYRPNIAFHNHVPVCSPFLRVPLMTMYRYVVLSCEVKNCGCEIRSDKASVWMLGEMVHCCQGQRVSWLCPQYRPRKNKWGDSCERRDVLVSGVTRWENGWGDLGDASKLTVFLCGKLCWWDLTPLRV